MDVSLEASGEKTVDIRIKRFAIIIAVFDGIRLGAGVGDGYRIYAFTGGQERERQVAVGLIS